MEVAEKPKTELSLPQRAAVALGSSELELSLKALAKKHADIVAVTDGTSRDQVHGAAMTLKSNRVAIQKTAKAAREDATAFQKAVIAEENRLVDIIEPEEKRLLELRDGYDAKVQAEREAKIAAERARIDAIKARIAFIANAPLTAVGLPSVGIDRIIQSLLAEVLDESYEEFLPEALAAHTKALQQLQSAVETALNAEKLAAQEAAARAAEAQRIAAEREELAKQRQAQEAVAEASRLALEAERAELAKQRAAADEAAAAQRKIEEDKLAEQRAELKKQQDAIDATRREQEEAARAAQAKIDAEVKAAADAEAKRLQDAADEVLAQEQAAAQAKKEAEDEQHMAEVHADIASDLVTNGFSTEQASELVALIRADKITNLYIQY